jgi:hypothetical protein
MVQGSKTVGQGKKKSRPRLKVIQGQKMCKKVIQGYPRSKKEARLNKSNPGSKERVAVRDLPPVSWSGM